MQDLKAADLHAARGVALREFELNPGHGTADYLLYVDARACGVIEAKKAGATLTGVEIQSARYAQGLPASLPAWRRPLPFVEQLTYLLFLTETGCRAAVDRTGVRKRGASAPNRAALGGAGYSSTMSYCSGFSDGSVASEIGLPMNSLRPARCTLSSSRKVSTTAALAMMRNSFGSNWRASRRISRRMS